MVESSSVESRGRGSRHHLGIWDDGHVEGLSRLASAVRARGASVGIQLGHSGRKAWNEAPDSKGFGLEQPVGPTGIPYAEDWNPPRALTVEEIEGVVEAYRQAARRARQAGFDVIDLHAAHGYLINQFLSPLVNHREDEYGGSLAGRLRLLHRVVEAIRDEWPEKNPLFVRVSASEYAPGGIDVAQMVEIVRTLPEQGVDLIDCSSGGVVPVPIPIGPGYQVPFAHRVKRETGIPTAAVGLITTPEMADEIIRNRRADLVALGRELLRHPYWPLDAAAALGVEVGWPAQYRRARV
jgi:NADPH2 dehydrogenase